MKASLYASKPFLCEGASLDLVEGPPSAQLGICAASKHSRRAVKAKIGQSCRGAFAGVQRDKAQNTNFGRPKNTLTATSRGGGPAQTTSRAPPLAIIMARVANTRRSPRSRSHHASPTTPWSRAAPTRRADRPATPAPAPEPPRPVLTEQRRRRPKKKRRFSSSPLRPSDARVEAAAAGLVQRRHFTAPLRLAANAIRAVDASACRPGWRTIHALHF